MNETLLGVALVLLFIFLSSLASASEIGLVSLRDSQIGQLESRGRRGAKAAQLARNPNRFLGAVQIVSTVAGFFAAALGASLLADDVAPAFVRIGIAQSVAGPLALVLMTLVIALVTLVFAELVPKRIAMQRSAGVAMAVAPTVDRIASLLRPVLWVLSRATDVVVRLLGGDPAVQRVKVTGEELRELVSRHVDLRPEQRAILADVFSAGDRLVREVMRPRTDVEFLDATIPIRQAANRVSRLPHSRYPVIRGSADDVIGFVHVRDLLSPVVVNRSARVGEVARQILQLPGTKRVLAALSEMRRTGDHIALVVDEYGGTDGIVTLEDLVEELVGDIRDEYDLAAGEPLESAAGDLVVDGMMNVDEFAELTGVELTVGPYETVAGYVVAALGHVPSLGDVVDAGRCTIEVLVLEGRRASQLRIITTESGAMVKDATSTDGGAGDGAARARGGAGDDTGGRRGAGAWMCGRRHG